MGFKVLCEEYGPGELPAPLVFTHRAESARDYELAKADARQRAQERMDGDLAAMTEALRIPDLVIGVHAWNEQNFDDADAHLRVHAVRCRTRGYVFTQIPGETAWHSGGFEAVECDPHAVAEAVFDALPTAVAGRMTPAVSGLSSSSAHSAGHPVPMVVDGDWRDSARIRSVAAFLAIPASRTGLIEIRQGRSKYGPRGLREAALRWRDLPDDGRYGMSLYPPVSIVAMSSAEMLRWARAQVDYILTDMDSDSDYA